MAWLRRRKQARTKAAVLDAAEAFQVSDSYYAQRFGRISQAYADVNFVYEIVFRVAAMGAALPIKIYTRDGSTNVEARNHPAYELLLRPNESTPRSLMMSELFADLQLHGNAFWLKVRDGSGKPKELWRLRPERMEPVPDENGKLIGWKHTINGKITGFLDDEVVHFRTPNPTNDYVGLAPIEALRYATELGRDAEGAAIDLWANGMMPHGYAQAQTPLSDEAIARLAADFRSMLAGRGNRYRWPILEEGMELRSLALSPRDAEFISTANLARERVAEAFGFPLAEKYPQASPEDIRRAIYANAVMLWTPIIEDTINTFLMPEWGEGVFAQYVTRHIFEPDLPARYQAYKDGVYAGWLPPAWVARLEDVPADLPRYIPLNMVEVAPDGSITPRPEPTPRNDTTGGMGGDQGQGGPSTGAGNAKGRVPWWEGKGG